MKLGDNKGKKILTPLLAILVKIIVFVTLRKSNSKFSKITIKVGIKLDNIQGPLKKKIHHKKINFSEIKNTVALKVIFQKICAKKCLIIHYFTKKTCTLYG